MNRERSFPRGLEQAPDARCSLDALLLAGFAPAGKRCVDLGTGCGVVGIGLLLLGKTERVWGLDSDAEQIAAAAQNAAIHSLAERFTAVCADVLAPKIPESRVDLVVSNPPWRRQGEERTPASARRCKALYAGPETLDNFTRGAALRLQDGGRFACITGADRLDDMLVLLRQYQFAPARLLCVHSRAGSEARFVLLESRFRVRCRLRIEPPLYVHEGQGYTRNVLDLCPWLTESAASPLG